MPLTSASSICKREQILLLKEIVHEFLADIGNLKFIKAQHALADLYHGLKCQCRVGLLDIQRDEINALYGLDPFPTVIIGLKKEELVGMNPRIPSRLSIRSHRIVCPVRPRVVNHEGLIL